VELGVELATIISSTYISKKYHNTIPVKIEERCNALEGIKPSAISLSLRRTCHARGIYFKP
jgi:hypothetical protein